MNRSDVYRLNKLLSFIEESEHQLQHLKPQDIHLRLQRYRGSGDFVPLDIPYSSFPEPVQDKWFKAERLFMFNVYNIWMEALEEAKKQLEAE